MSQSHSNYMDGVPVKISEKYKPPPKVSLPQSVQQRLSNTDLNLLSLNYDFALEQNVLIKIKEWKAVIENERCDRRERIRLKEVEGRKFIEEKQKQLLNDLSYPSAEDLSSEDETEETLNETPQNPAAHNTSQNETTQTNYNNQGGYFNPLNKFDTILTPTVVPEKHINNYNNPLACETNHDHHNNNNNDNNQNNNNNNNHFVNNNNNNNTSSTNNSNFYKINYSDFENDTSSPFDNMELKTINDLDILAQCLNTNNSTNNKHSDDNINDGNQLLDNLDNNLYNFNYNQSEHQNIQNTNNYYNQLYTNFNNEQNNIYGNPQQSQQQIITTTTTTNQQIDNAAIYAPNYNTNSTITHNYNNITNDNHNHSVIPYCNVNGYNIPNNEYYFTNNSLGTTTTSITNQNYAAGYNNYNQQHQQHHDVYYPYQISSSGENNLPIVKQTVTETTLIKNVNNDDEQTVVAANTKNKSKSVPDIIKELNDELIDSEKKRTRNNSQTITTPKHNVKPTKSNKSLYKDVRKMNNEIKNTRTTGGVTTTTAAAAAGVTTTANLINKLKDLTFNKLSQSSQNLATNISSMGFPLERVSRVVKLYGNDDKKIVEHLIPLSELLDLGFDEIKISDALVKFNNNKEKALDFLIS